MTIEITDIHMAIGGCRVDLNWNAEVDEELTDPATGKPRPVHVLFYDPDDNLFDIRVLLSKESSSKGITLGGPGIDWWSGAGDTGPLIRERKFVSGNNWLTDPGFELNVAGEDFEHWSAAGESTWIAAVGEARGGSLGAALVYGDPVSDDVLTSTEGRSAAAGEQHILEVWLKRVSGGVGRIRPRIVYTGRFVHPDLSSPYSGWGASARGDIVLTTDPLAIIAGPVYRIQTAIPNLVTNGSFDGGGGFTGWTRLPASGDWDIGTDGGHNGPNYAFTDGGPAWKELVAPAITVAEGEGYEFWTVGRINPGSPATDGEAYAMVGMAGGATADDFIKTSTIRNDNGVGNWQLVKGSVTVDPGRTVLRPQIVVEGETGGRWDFDDLTVIRVSGNIDAVLAPTIPVTTGRTYQWSLPYRCDAGVNGGRVQVQAILEGAGRPQLILTGPDLQQSADSTIAGPAVWDIAIPSGYTNLYPVLYSEDVTGGAIWVGRGTIVDTDTTTTVFDGLSSAYDPNWTGYQVTGTAPAGTETAHAELVAEELAGWWLADDVFFARTGIVPATIGDVIAALLTYPSSGEPLPVLPGTIYDSAAVINHDFTVVNQHCRDAREYFARTVCNPPREWWINGATREMDFGLSSQVFADRTDLVFLLSDLDVADIPPGTTSSEDLASDVLVIGAERPSTIPNTRPRLVTATATSVTGVVDFNGRAFDRTKLIEDSSVDHSLGAAALARDEADRTANPARSFSITLDGTRPGVRIPTADDIANGIAAVKSGDWVYAYHRAAGILDTTNPMEIEGRTVWPQQLRVLSVTRRPLNVRVAVRRLDGSSFALAGLTPNTADEVVLELGTRQEDELLDRPVNPLLRLRAQSQR